MSESEKLERPATATNAQEGTSTDVIESDAILNGKQEVLIQHGETTYRLRITQNGKLILCK
ncbi:hemin uptake protein HemP [Gimesia chilikensis]|uniref:hemin uptake protein HemP n=1 Tax=Gimesia chilikensis TaxID=2605989 RepID=UPI003A914F72